MDARRGDQPADPAGGRRRGDQLFDTANVYSGATSEEIFGRALKELTRRDEVVVVTKVHGRMRPGPNGAGLGRKAIMAEIDASLQRLGTGYVDLYQIHRFDYDVPIKETLDALHDVVKAGKVRYINGSVESEIEMLRPCGSQRSARTTRRKSFVNWNALS